MAWSSEELSAADEVDDCVAVAGSDECTGPAIARKNGEIPLDGDAVGTNAEMVQQPRNINARRNLFHFPIQDYFNGAGRLTGG